MTILPESISGNGMRKIVSDFQIQTDYLIRARGPDLELINKVKKNLPSSEFCHSREPQSESERKRKNNQIFGPYQGTKNKNTNKL